MNAILYILLGVVRYTFSSLCLLVITPLMLINWALAGEVDNDEGLLGLVCFNLPAWIQDTFKVPLVRLHKSYKPAAWTFKGSVATYRHSIRWWTNKAAGNFEYRQRVRANVNYARNKKEKRYWETIKTRMEARIAKEEAESKQEVV